MATILPPLLTFPTPLQHLRPPPSNPRLPRQKTPGSASTPRQIPRLAAARRSRHHGRALRPRASRPSPRTAVASLREPTPFLPNSSMVNGPLVANMAEVRAPRDSRETQHAMSTGHRHRSLDPVAEVAARSQATDLHPDALPSPSLNFGRRLDTLCHRHHRDAEATRPLNPLPRVPLRAALRQGLPSLGPRPNTTITKTRPRQPSACVALSPMFQIRPVGCARARGPLLRRCR